MLGEEASIPNTYVTSASITLGCAVCFGSYWDMNYISDPILDYLNPLRMNPQYLESSRPNNPKNFILNVSNPAGMAAPFVFEFQNPIDFVLIQNGSERIKIVPQPTTAPAGNPLNYGYFSNPITLRSGWSYVGAPPTGMTANRLECPVYQGPQCP